MLGGSGGVLVLPRGISTGANFYAGPFLHKKTKRKEHNPGGRYAAVFTPKRAKRTDLKMENGTPRKE